MRIEVMHTGSSGTLRAVALAIVTCSALGSCTSAAMTASAARVPVMVGPVPQLAGSTQTPSTAGMDAFDTKAFDLFAVAMSVPVRASRLGPGKAGAEANTKANVSKASRFDADLAKGLGARQQCGARVQDLGVGGWTFFLPLVYIQESYVEMQTAIHCDGQVGGTP